VNALTRPEGRAALPPPAARRWELLPPADPAAVQGLVEALRLPRPLCALLVQRGFGEVEPAKAHLRPRLDQLLAPHTMAGAPEAVERIAQALDRGEEMLVHGDYDVDGISGTALLTRWLRALGGKVTPFLPHRLKHGYDLGEGGVSRAREVGATLIITVDCGMRAHGALESAARLGIDVIVTDHHTPGATLPPAIAVVNPNRLDCPYPHKGLSGTGVAFKLCELLAERRGRTRDELLPLLELVALATIADQVPLSGENRVLVRYGLRFMEESAMPGLRSLLEATKASAPYQSGDIGFRVAPRLNAAGRISDPTEALDVLLASGPEEGARGAEELEALNRRRQSVEAETLEAALEQLADTFDPERDHGVVLAGEGWHPGVIGIVAARITERIHRPAILIALDGGKGTGSARSIPGFHLVEAVAACAEHLDRYGGHAMAAGMGVRTERVPLFREAFAREAARRLAGAPLHPTLRVDAELGLAEITADLARYLPYLGPFGTGNPTPVFLARGLEIVASPRLLRDGHVKFQLGSGAHTIDAIGFRMAERIPPRILAGEGPVDAVFEVSENEWQGRRTAQLVLRDLRGGDAPPRARG